MPFITPSFTTIRDDLLRDIRNQMPDASTGPDSDYRVRASSVASVAEGLYNHQAWITRQIFPDTADTEYLELHCRLRNIFRKPATTASGTVTMTAEPGAVAPAGLMVRRDNRTWTTTEQVTAGTDGTATARASASVPGVAGNTTAQMSGIIHHSDRGSQYVSLAYTQRLKEAEAMASVGTVGDSYDNALAESINGLYKAEVIHRQSWKNRQDVELATLDWVDWFNNRRLLERIGYVAPVEAEQTYYASLMDKEQAA